MFSLKHWSLVDIRSGGAAHRAVELYTVVRFHGLQNVFYGGFLKKNRPKNIIIPSFWGSLLIFFADVAVSSMFLLFDHKNVFVPQV